MIVYVESNFVLELAYLQEQHQSCNDLLALAEAKRIRIALPAFSITEARLSVLRRAHRRRRLHDRIKRELRELARSKPYHELSGTTAPLTSALIESGEIEKQRLDAVSSRLLTVCEMLPMQGKTIQSALLQEASIKLSPNDAVVFASILEDLASRPKGPKCFLNRNSRDFANPDVYDELSKFDCKLLPSFKDGLGYIQGVISREAQQTAEPENNPSA